ncbi:NAD-dependent epimerase/dehydratase family protein [Billgrantia kenyensis]|uniref:SDR family oxidoreductase n=1 Tax=Billgrantia kenyensis TaxID=321266 RepID=A0A7V9W521_9GAMM|nr:SDR family oxidoreductase [Halomonas kenyensis]MBA2781152.1 SDR family oxidoreductase [Halomonas kenyensis]MCG6663852.1 SDR family oxidoreductase [Halomonas kenyensis]
MTGSKVVLVTGAGGYIGSVLVPKLLNKGYKVKAVDRFFFGGEKLAPHPELEIIQEDTRHLKLNHFRNVDYVIDLVAISNDPSGEQFEEATWQINYRSRVKTAELARRAGAKRYILPSSCSIYGFQNDIVDETSPTNPLTIYAKANEKAEQDVLKLASGNYVVTVMRQATIFGYSPRMRFDLAINGMTYGAYTSKRLPLMRDGNQYRPMLHVQDATDVMCLLLQADPAKVNGEVFNIGSEQNTYQLGRLGKKIADTVGGQLGQEVAIEWYGDPDHRSYRVSFGKIEDKLGWRAQWSAEEGCREILLKLESGELQKTTETITLAWYQEMVKWHKIIKSAEMYGGILDI